MARAECPHCRKTFPFDREAGGVTVCPRCNRRVTLPDSTPPPEPPPAATAVRTVALIGALAAGVFIAFFAVVAVIQARKPLTPAEQQERAVRAAKEDRESKERAERAEESARQATSVVLVVVYILVVVAWLVALYFAGAWIARDAHRRGMPGLGWAAFYFAGQLVNRLVMTLVLFALASGLFAVSAAAAAAGGVGRTAGGIGFGVALLLVVASEPLHWVGMWVYLFARRPGRLVLCPHCREYTLATRPACTNCDHSVGP